ncbi:MAG: alpha/beta hydrolase [Candidatus Eremiobacteraeota bacterium]|nr:alpha/beta hydrolase [Candidatus Eremiobacteraeota bacterium]
MGTFSPLTDRLLERDHPGVSARGRTAVHVHGGRRPRAFVLLHGMSASPPQFDRFALELFARGHNVLVPRLPRHGHADRNSTALARLKPDDLYAAVSDYVAIARELGERVTVAGFSLGGLLAAWSAQHFELDRCVAIAPFLGVAWIPSVVMPGVAEVLLRMPNQFHWWNPIVRERHLPAHGYPRYATHAIAHAHRIARDVLRGALMSPPLARRVVLVVNAREAGVNNRAIRRLYARWHARRPEGVELVTLRGLPLSHDIVEPLRRGDLAARAYPQLLAAIDP